MKLVGSLGAERWTTPLPSRICLDVISFQCANFEVLEADLIIYRGSYMSAYVLLNLLNELGLAEHFISFRNEFNQFNNTRARMLDSIYHMTNTLKSHFWRKDVIIMSLYRNVVMEVITFPVNL